MIRSYLLIAVLLCSISPLFAQQTSPLINSGEEIAEGLKLFENTQYKEAIEHYAKVGSYDTNYVWALYELARTCSADSQFVKGMEYCKRGIARHDDRERLPDFLTLQGLLYGKMEQPQTALLVFDSALVKYPAYTNLYVNKGNILFYQKKYTEAAEVFKQGLLVNPYSALLHFNLGVTALNQGNPVGAFLSLTTYLILDPTGGYSGSSISLLGNISLAKDNIVEAVGKRDYEIADNFMQIEQIVLSKIALEKNYKPIIKIDDQISRQMQVIFEKLEYDPASNDFWMQYYVPYFQKVFADKKFEVLVNYAFSGVDVESIKKYNKANKKEIQRFAEDLEKYFNLVRGTRELYPSKRESFVGSYFFSEGKLNSKGVITNGKYAGDWIFYYPAGNIKSKGRLTEKEEKTGEWRYYHYNGTLKATEYYDNGKQKGDEVYYFDNGNIFHTATYKDGELEGKKTNYYREGNIKDIENYKNGKLNGEYTEYYYSGFKKSYAKYVDEKFEGTFTTYYSNGKIEKTGVYLKGLLNGPYKKYYENGNLSLESVYENDLLTGIMKTYHENGKIKSTETYLKGELNGDYSQYYDNGQLYFYCLYKNGVYDGNIDYKDTDGAIYSTITYVNDLPVSAKYMDKKGKEISSSVKNNGKITLVSYSAEGFKRSETPYNDKGSINGTRKYFYSSGKISEVDEYTEGELNGKVTWYHPNEKVSTTASYSGGKRNGYYCGYTLKGMKDREGWYKEEQQEGKWTFYDEQGKLSSEVDFFNDIAHGIQKEYWPDGKLKLESTNINNHLQEIIQYDTLGKELSRMTLTRGNGKYKMLHFNGKTSAEGTYKNGNLEGPLTYYFFDGSTELIRCYKGGLLDSIYRVYYYGGKVKTDGQYSMDDKVGTWKYYRANGKLSSVEKYENGELVDTMKYYHENGKLSFIATYKNGVREGITEKYTEDGLLVYRLIYKDGTATAYSYLDASSKFVPEIAIPDSGGEVKTYYPNGKLSAEFAYSDGKVNGSDNVYYPDGKPQMISTEYYSNSEGPYKQYYPGGKIQYEYNYQNDNMHGQYKEYSQTGTLIELSDYYNGSFHGRQVRYDEKGKPVETRYYYYGRADKSGKMKYEKLAVCLIFFSVGFAAKAQSPEDIQKKYPGEQAVILNASENYKISMQAGKPHVESSENTQILYFSGGSNLSRYYFYHSSFHEVKNYSAFTQTSDRRKLKVSDFKTFNSSSSGVFYDDVKKTSFDFPGVAPGAVANLDVSFVHNNPYLLSPYYFKRGIPVIKNKLVISCPANVSLKYMLRGNDTSSIKCTKTTKRGETVYTFEVNDVPGEKSYADAPGSPYFSTHVVFYIENYTDETGQKIKYLSNVDDLYAFNYSFIKGVNKTPDAGIKTIVGELTKDTKTAEDKARNIYRWVQQNIKYVAFEDGMGGFVPRDGNLICSRKYGDCKDMASILVLMLNTAGVPAYFTWIGTRSLPYNYTELPVPVVDNHMIAAIKKDNGEFIFLDGTDSHCIFGVPPHSIQDKEALISISGNEYKIVKVPVVPKEKNRLTDSTFVRLADKGITGDIKLNLEGYFATDARSEMQYVAEKDNERYMRSLMMRGSNKFMLNKYGSVNTSDVAHISVTGSFSLDDYARKIGNEWYINMNLMKLYEHEEIDYPKRKMPVEFDYRFIKKYVTVLEIPDGYKVSYLPENKSYSNKVWGFSMKYSQAGNKLFLTQEFYNEHLLLQPGDFEAWNDVLKNLFPLYKETITLSGK